MVGRAVTATASPAIASPATGGAATTSAATGPLVQAVVSQPSGAAPGAAGAGRRDDSVVIAPVMVLSVTRPAVVVRRIQERVVRVRPQESHHEESDGQDEQDHYYQEDHDLGHRTIQRMA